MKNNVGAVQAAVMLLLGIFAGLKLHVSLLLCCLLFGAGMAGGIFFYLRGKNFVLDQLPKRLSRYLFCLALFAIGMGRTVMLNEPHPIGAAENYAGQYIEGMTGYVVSLPVTTPSRTTLRVQLDGKQSDSNLPTKGKVLLVFYRDPKIDFHYGDRILFSGTLVLPPDTGSGFSYRTYLERDGITCMINNPQAELLPGFSGSHIRAAIYRLRAALVNRVYRLFPKPESALMAGILLGDETQIPSQIERDFQKTGTAHIIAISGSNFTLLLWVLLSIIRRVVPRWWSPLLILPFIAFYTILVGGNSAVIRAAIMCALSVFGSVLGRTGYGVNNLALTAAVMCLWKPVMLFDLGFQLSAMATLGILMFSEPLCGLARTIFAKIFPKISEETLNVMVNLTNDLCLMSISAQIFTMWISAQAFGRISLISLPANFLIAPFQSMIMLGGFAALLLSFIFYPLGAAAAWLVWAAPALTIRIVRFCAAVRWGSVYSDLSPLQAWLVMALILFLWLGRHVIADSIRRRNYQPYAALLLLFTAVMVWTNAAARLDRKTEIEFYQTSSTQTLRICSPENRLFVIGDGLTNYAAQDILGKQMLPIQKIPAAAFLDLSEEWMTREFLASGAADELSLYYLNGESRRPGEKIPEELSAGFRFTADGIILRVAASFLGKRAWLVESEGITLLFPNGVPPERIFLRSGADERDISLVIFGRRDDQSRWKNHSCQFLDLSKSVNSTLVLKKGNIFYR